MSTSSSSNMITVAKSLETVMATDAMITFIRDNREFWPAFGKKNSHSLRNSLFGLFTREKLSGEARFWIYFFHAVIKDCNRIVASMDTLPDDIKSQKWFTEVKDFINKRMVKFTRQESKDKFASVHLPNTNPGLDIFCAALVGPDPIDEDSLGAGVNDIISRTTFAQLRCNKQLLEANKAASKDYWDNTVKIKNAEERKKSQAKGMEVGFQEDYWNTSAADEYLLVARDAEGNLKEWSTPNPYNREDLMRWYGAVHGKKVTFSGGRAITRDEKDKKKEKEKETKEVVEEKVVPETPKKLEDMDLPQLMAYLGSAEKERARLEKEDDGPLKTEALRKVDGKIQAANHYINKKAS